MVRIKRTTKFCKDCKKDVPVENFRVKEKKYKEGSYRYLNNLCKPCEKVYQIKYVK